MAESWGVGSDDGCHTAAHDGDIQMIDSNRSRPPSGRDGKKGDGDHCLGCSRGGLTAKMHAVVDGQGLSIRLSLTAEQTHDGQAADNLLGHVGAGTIGLADKAYDADCIRDSLREKGAFANMPPQSNAGQNRTSAHGIIANGTQSSASSPS